MLWLAVLGGLAVIVVWSYRRYPEEAPALSGTLVLAVVTLALARVTAYMAWYTKRYAVETKALVDATHSAMRTQLRPVLGLRKHGDDVFPYNYGIGPAMNVEVRQSVLPLKGLPEPHRISPDWPGLLCLGPKEGTPEVAKFVWKVTPSGESIKGVTVDHVFTGGAIILEYTDVFGQRFQTILADGKWCQKEMPDGA